MFPTTTSSTSKFPYRFGSSFSTLGIDVGSLSTKIVWTNRGRFGGLEWAALRIPTRGKSTKEPSSDPSDSSQNSRSFSPAMHERTAPATECSRLEITQLAKNVSQAVRNAGIRRIDLTRMAISMHWCELRSDGAATVPQANSSPSGSLDIGVSVRKMCSAELPRNDQTADDPSGHRRISVPEDFTRILADAFDAERIELRALDGVPWCIARAQAFENTGAADSVELVLDWGYNCITLVALYRGEIFYCRKFDGGGLHNAVESLTGELGLTVNEALHLIEKYARTLSADRDQRRASDICAAPLKDHARTVTEQIQLAARYINWRLPSVSRTSIVLMGGGAFQSVLREFLEQTLRLPTRSWSWIPPGSQHPMPPDLAIAASLARWD